MTSPQKKEVVTKLVDTLKNTKNFALVTFEKTGHQKLESLRKDLKKEGAGFKVIKNTLLEKAINKLGTADKLYLDFKKKFLPLKELTAIMIFSDDWSKPLKTFHKFAKSEKTLSFKVGIIDKQTFDESGLSKLAQLPSKEEIIATILGSMKSPSSHFVYSLKYNIQKFVYILSQKANKPVN